MGLKMREVLINGKELINREGLIHGKKLINREGLTNGAPSSLKYHFKMSSESYSDMLLCAFGMYLNFFYVIWQGSASTLTSVTTVTSSSTDGSSQQTYSQAHSSPPQSLHVPSTSSDSSRSNPRYGSYFNPNGDTGNTSFLIL